MPPPTPLQQLRRHRAGRTYSSFIRCWYSGYIVPAPPRAASAGMPNSRVGSVRKGLVPGR